MLSNKNINEKQLSRRIDSLNMLIRSHAGGLKIEKVLEDGEVVVRYTGMCTGCDYRSVTTAGTVEPALLDVPGVTRVRVVGAQVSDMAALRIGTTVTEGAAAARAIRLVRRIENLETTRTKEHA